MNIGEIMRRAEIDLAAIELSGQPPTIARGGIEHAAILAIRGGPIGANLEIVQLFFDELKRVTGHYRDRRLEQIEQLAGRRVML